MVSHTSANIDCYLDASIQAACIFADLAVLVRNANTTEPHFTLANVDQPAPEANKSWRVTAGGDVAHFLKQPAIPG